MIPKWVQDVPSLKPTHVLGPSEKVKMPDQPFVRWWLWGMRVASSHRSGRKSSASGPQTHAKRLTVREGIWMTWPFVTGISFRTCVPSGERTGHRKGITSSFATTFSVCADEGNTRSLVIVILFGHKNAKKEEEGSDVGAYAPFFYHGVQVRQGFAVPYLVKGGFPTKLEDFFSEFLLTHGVLCEGPEGEMDDPRGGFVPDEEKSGNVLDELLGGHGPMLFLAFPSADWQ